MSEGRMSREEEPTTSEREEQKRMSLAARRWNSKKRFSKQLSIMCQSQQDIAWEKRRSQIRRKSGPVHDAEDLTDEDMKELKGFMELGFRFSEEDGERLGSTLPALDLYLAVNRHVCPSPVSTPHSARLSPASSFAGSPTRDSDHWKICSPGEDPKQVKNKLRQWAQVVAFSVMHSQ
uniref:Uncharacterized protein n=1 Tax=Kalanchoe fedtschenkoi TaxID=63787 RepID=A0A7N0T4Y6_KALFE